jgi:adenylosuccinate lyase
MRRFGIEQPYEKLKTFTRGQKIIAPLLHQFITELPLEDTVKQQLLALTPANYIGLASDLAKRI